MSGDWMLMAHGYAWGVYSDQGGPRGSEKAFVQSMAMLDASRPLGDGAGLQLRAMASLDPLMGKRGYPILFASGETANGDQQGEREDEKTGFNGDSWDYGATRIFSSPPGRHLLVCFPFQGKSLPPGRRGRGWGWVLPGLEIGSAQVLH